MRKYNKLTGTREPEGGKWRKGEEKKVNEASGQRVCRHRVNWDTDMETAIVYSKLTLINRKNLFNEHFWLAGRRKDTIVQLYTRYTVLS